MDVFTEVYDQSVELLKVPCFDKRWSNIEPKLKRLFAIGGPSAPEADVLDSIRSSLSLNVKPIHIASAIVSLSQPGTAGFQNRSALIKLLQHFYFVEAKGAQSVWVVDHPSGYAKWSYDELSGKSATDIVAPLALDTETFGPAQRKTMSDSLQLARKWAMDVVAKLGAADKDTKDKVRRWFLPDGATDTEVDAAVATLSGGFKKIADTCNSTKVIFSDRPHKRFNGGNATTFASVNGGDKMPVIYIFKLFLAEGEKAAGEVGKLWLCALTIIHELSHKLQGTKDKSYDTQGLKPGGRSLVAAEAINNADSWAYFAADIVGAIPDAKLKAYYL
jgi:hypothetical protein